MSVASYLQMTEVVHSCRAFINDALNISIKQEAPDSVVLDYNKRRMLSKDGAGGCVTTSASSSENKKSTGNFWATSILSKLSIKASTTTTTTSCLVKEEPNDSLDVSSSANDSCCSASGGAGTPEYTDDGAKCGSTVGGTQSGVTPVFVWNEPVLNTGVSVKVEAGASAGTGVGMGGRSSEPGSGRRKKQAARRFVYNFPPPPEPEEGGFDEGMYIQPSASYKREDFKREEFTFLSDNTGEGHTHAHSGTCTHYVPL